MNGHLRERDSRYVDRLDFRVHSWRETTIHIDDFLDSVTEAEFFDDGFPASQRQSVSQFI